MVGIQQLFIPAALIGLAVSVPLAPQADIAVRDINDGVEYDLATRELDLEIRDLEDFDFDLVLRSLYNEELDLETRANLLGAVKAIAPALKNIKKVLPGPKALTAVVSGAVKAKNVVVGAAKSVAQNKGATYDRLLKTANTGMAAAKTIKSGQGKRDVEDHDSTSTHHSKKGPKKGKKRASRRKSRHAKKIAAAKKHHEEN